MLYFIAVYIVGNIFLLNMFVGVMVDNFGRMAVLLESASNPDQNVAHIPHANWDHRRVLVLLQRPKMKIWMTMTNGRTRRIAVRSLHMLYVGH